MLEYVRIYIVEEKNQLYIFAENNQLYIFAENKKHPEEDTSKGA